MQDQNTTSPTIPTPPVPPVPPVPKEAEAPKAPAVPPVPPVPVSKNDTNSAGGRPSMMPKNDLLRRITEKIKSSENILVALSRDPSVDELAGSIGLTMFLDGLQKHTTAIYSGQAPDALQFLQPEGTFETNTDSLQDFIISLNKEKADHLRYKLDGDFVRVYITPYKTLISEDDLEFSRGDYNVDLVLAIGVPSAEDLDGALSEYGRIMHDATTVDITCDAPGKFGEIEWSDPGASSVSEMITKLIFALEGPDAKIDKEIATALLTGIVAATGRFSNDRTNSDTMQLASKLMSMGADQQLISAHVMDNDPVVSEKQDDFSVQQAETPEADKTNLAVHQLAATPKPSDAVVVAPDVAQPQQSAPVPATSAVDKAMQERQAMNARAEAMVNQAVTTAAANAAAAGATGVGIGSVPTKDYGQMMAEALSSQSESLPPAGGQIVTPAPANLQPAQPAEQVQSETPQQPAKPESQAPVNAKLVKNDTEVVLPPPPAPEVAGQAMPPVLPPVQVPDEMRAQQAQPVTQPTSPDQGVGQPGAQSGAFQIPGA